MNIKLIYIMAVWRRHFEIYKTLWRTNFLPPVTEPLIFFVSFGIGVGTLVTYVHYHQKPINYLDFIIPTIIAITIMFQSFFECLYGSFIRLFYQNTLQNIISTPVSLAEAILGDIIWAATISFINGTIVTMILFMAGYLQLYHLWPIPLYCFLNGLAYSSMGMLCTSIIKKIEQTNYPLYLLINPLHLLSGTYYPIEIYPVLIQKIAKFSPFYYTTNGLREWIIESSLKGMLQSTIYHLALFVIFSAIAIRNMKKRLIP